MVLKLYVRNYWKIFLGAHFLNNKILNVVKLKQGENNVCFQGLLLKENYRIINEEELCIIYNYTNTFLYITIKKIN